MCSGVIIHRPGQEDIRCDTQGELAQALDDLCEESMGDECQCA